MRRARAGLNWALSVLAVLAGVAISDLTPSLAQGSTSVLAVRQKAGGNAPGSDRKAYSRNAETASSAANDRGSPSGAESPGSSGSPRSDWSRLVSTGSTAFSGDRKTQGHGLAGVPEGWVWGISKAAFCRTEKIAESACSRTWQARQGRAPPATARI